MLFRQLFDPETSTYSYLLADDSTHEAVLIDSVLEQVERDMQLIAELELRLVAALETHVHADPVTGAGLLREGIRSLPAAARLYPAHDYKGRTVTTVAEARRSNPRLADARSRDEFVALMRGLNLPYPQRMDEALPEHWRFKRAFDRE